VLSSNLEVLEVLKGVRGVLQELKGCFHPLQVT